MKKSEFESMIREIVQKEIQISMKRYVQAYVPIVVNEIVGDLIGKKLDEVTKALPVRRAKSSSPSSGMSLNEISRMVEQEDDKYGIDGIEEASEREWATHSGKPVTAEKARNWDRASLAARMGYEDMPMLGGPENVPQQPRAFHSGPVTVDTIVTDKGTVIPVNPNSIPDDLSAAFNRNYTDLLNRLNERTR